MYVCNYINILKLSVFEMEHLQGKEFASEPTNKKFGRLGMQCIVFQEEIL